MMVAEWKVQLKLGGELVKGGDAGYYSSARFSPQLCGRCSRRSKEVTVLWSSCNWVCVAYIRPNQADKRDMK